MSEASHKGGSVCDVRNGSGVSGSVITHGSIGVRRQFPVNAAFQLVALKLAPSHLRLERRRHSPELDREPPKEAVGPYKKKD